MFAALDNYLPLATALRESLRRGYRLRDFRRDLVSALVVSLVALPLAMALAIAVGLPPQHGIYTAIVAGILTPLLGGSIMQVSGPTAAFVVIIAPILTQHGLRGLIIAEVMAGIMLVALAWAKLGRFITFVPYPVTTGFTSGIAVVLATLSLNDLLGLGIASLQGSFLEKVTRIAHNLGDVYPPEAAIGLLSLLVMFFGKRITTKIPSIILGIIAGTLLALFFTHQGMAVATIGNHFSYLTPQGLMQQGIPPYPPSLHHFGEAGLFAWPSFSELQALLMPAVVIAALAALESLLSASVADGMARTKHNPNAELAAIGLANMASGLAAGIPATGAIARTTTNIKSGAVSPLASAMHGVLIMAYVMALAPLISYIPMASLAALLVVIAYNMSHYRQFWRIIKIAPRQDAAVLLVCFTFTVFIDMVAGVSIGIMLAALLFIQRMALATEVTVDQGGTPQAGAIPANVMVYHISGPLFFATVERAFDRTAFLRHRVDTLILDMVHVPLIDMTGLVALKMLVTSDVLAGKQIIICARPDIISMVLQKLSHEKGLHVKTAHDVNDALSLIKTGA